MNKLQCLIELKQCHIIYTKKFNCNTLNFNFSIFSTITSYILYLKCKLQIYNGKFIQNLNFHFFIDPKIQVFAKIKFIYYFRCSRVYA